MSALLDLLLEAWGLVAESTAVDGLNGLLLLLLVDGRRGSGVGVDNSVGLGGLVCGHSGVDGLLLGRGSSGGGGELGSAGVLEGRRLLGLDERVLDGGGHVCRIGALAGACGFRARVAREGSGQGRAGQGRAGQGRGG